MGLLIKQDGFSIIESLLGIVLLGLVLVFTVIVFDNIWNNPALTIKGEAFLLADQEIKNAVNGKAFSDTSYNNLKNNLFLKKQVKQSDNCYHIEVTVTHIPTKKEIITLSAISGE